MTTSTKFCPNWDSLKTHRVDRRFGYTDTKGREFGALARVGTIEAVPGDSLIYGRQFKRAGLHFVFHPHATRGGKPYGAVQMEQFFETAEERDAAMERYFKGAEARAAKNKARR